MITKDQHRARLAYNSFDAVPEPQREDYRIAVHGLGMNIIRMGLCAAIAWLQRSKTEGAKLLLDHLAEANLPGLHCTGRDDIPGAIRRLDAAEYMLITREILQLALWFRRAVQANEGNTP